MPQSCTVCRHASRDAIDQALDSAVSLRSIAGRHGVALASLSRHKQHVGNGCGTAPEHSEQPAATRPAVSPAVLADLRLQVAALRQQADQLRRAHRPYHDYQADAILTQMASLLANVVEILWPEEHDTRADTRPEETLGKRTPWSESK
jgi:transposase-like protein